MMIRKAIMAGSSDDRRGEVAASSEVVPGDPSYVYVVSSVDAGDVATGTASLAIVSPESESTSII